MKRRQLLTWGLGLTAAAKLWPPARRAHATDRRPAMSYRIPLPAPSLEGRLSLERVLAGRRSQRELRGAAIPLAALAQLLWAAQGVTHGRGYRTAPSAGALYPFELFAVAGLVDGLAAGIYRYRPDEHDLLAERRGDYRHAVMTSAHQQVWIADAAVILSLSAVPARTTGKYGGRGINYIRMEAGHIAQNVCLQAVALGLGATPVGAFDDAALKAVLPGAADEEPVYLLPVGVPQA